MRYTMSSLSPQITLTKGRTRIPEFLSVFHQCFIRGYFPLYSFVIVSSRLRMARLTIAHAATLCMFTFGGRLVTVAEPTFNASVVRSSSK